MSRARQQRSAARLNRLAQQRVRGGLLPIADAAALAAVGFEPISEVMGAGTWMSTPANPIGPGARYRTSTLGEQHSRESTGRHTATVASASVRPIAVNPLHRTWQMSYGVRSGYQAMLDRLRDEAREIGADGVVGVTVQVTTQTGFGNGITSFLALGTAVRASAATHSADPFGTTHGRRSPRPLRLYGRTVPCCRA